MGKDCDRTVVDFVTELSGMWWIKRECNGVRWIKRNTVRLESE